ncbi:MAG: PA14 domain-containing protein [Anaerolineae bacterium]
MAIGNLSDGLILYGLAIAAFIYAFRQTELVEPETANLAATRTAIAPERLRLGRGLLAVSGLSAFLALRLFPQTPTPKSAWHLYLISIASFVAAFMLMEEVNPLAWRRIAWPPRRELLLLALIVLGGTFMRFYQLHTIPFGLFYDEAVNGLDARRVVEQGIYPVYFEDNYGRGGLFIYLLALAFKVLGISALSMRLLTATSGLLAVLAFYLLFRLLFDARLGLVAASLLAFSRWHVNFSRVVFDAVLLPLLLALTIYFLLRGLRSRRYLHFVGGGLALGLGLHSYVSFRLVPFVLILFFLYKLASERGFLKRNWLSLAIFIAASLLVFAPLGQYALQHREMFMKRAQAASIFTKRDQPDIVQALWSNTRKHLLMFNYRGDVNGRHNLPGEPMLDKVTAILFVLGLGYSLYRWRDHRSFLFLATFCIMLLGGILSVDFEAPQALRSIGTMPAVYFFAIVALYQVWREIQRVLPQDGHPYLAAGVVILLAVIGWTNYRDYFQRQARNFAVWNAFSTAETIVAREMSNLAKDHDLFVSSEYYRHPTVRFLAPRVTQYWPWTVNDRLPFKTEGSRGAALFLDPKLSAVYQEAQRYYPRASFTEFTSPFGGPTVLYGVVMGGDEVQAIQGLVGRYYQGETWEGQPVLERPEAKLEFDWALEPPLRGPFSAEWGGVLYTPRYGQYLLGLQTPAKGELFLDENLILDTSIARETTLTLAQGNHSLRVRAVGGAGRVEFYWQPTGETKAVVPQWALYQPPVSNHGLLGEYYPTPDWTGTPALARIDPYISFYFHNIPLPRPYTVEWRGVIAITWAGTYRFGTHSIDESYLYIDGQLVVDNPRRGQHVEGAVTLEPGWHELLLRYADRTDHSYVHLYWTPPGSGQEIIPSSRLLPPQGEYPAPEEGLVAKPPVLPGPVAGEPAGKVWLQPILIWGGEGTEQGEFNEPRDIAVDADGYVYVADTGNRRVQKFTPEGQFVDLWEGGDQDFVEPVALVVNSQDELFVLDSEPGWIYRFTTKGEYLGKFAGPGAQFFHPRGLTLDVQDNLYVADAGGSRVVKYSAAGSRLAIIGQKGSGPGQFLETCDVAVDGNGDLYVVDVANRRVQHLDSLGVYLGEWSIPEANARDGPHLAWARDGTLFITAPELHKVQRYTRAGELLDEWGGFGDGEGQFRLPVGLVVDPAGFLYVVDTYNHRVQKFEIVQ